MDIDDDCYIVSTSADCVLHSEDLKTDNQLNASVEENKEDSSKSCSMVKKMSFKCDMCYQASFQSQKALTMHLYNIHNISLENVTNSNDNYSKNNIVGNTKNNFAGNTNSDIVGNTKNNVVGTTKNNVVGNTKNKVGSTKNNNLGNTKSNVVGNTKNNVGRNTKNNIIELKKDGVVDNTKNNVGIVKNVVVINKTASLPDSTRCIKNFILEKSCSQVEKTYLKCNICHQPFKAQQPLWRHQILDHHISLSNFTYPSNSNSKENDLDRFAVNSSNNAIEITNNSNSKPSFSKIADNNIQDLSGSPSSISVIDLTDYGEATDNVPLQGHGHASIGLNDEANIDADCYIVDSPTDFITPSILLQHDKQLNEGVTNSSKHSKHYPLVKKSSFKCDICSCAFISENALQTHNIQVHKCSLCVCTFTFQKELLKHKADIHDTSIMCQKTTDNCNKDNVVVCSTVYELNDLEHIKDSSTCNEQCVKPKKTSAFQCDIDLCRVVTEPEIGLLTHQSTVNKISSDRVHNSIISSAKHNIVENVTCNLSDYGIADMGVTCNSSNCGTNDNCITGNNTQNFTFAVRMSPIDCHPTPNDSFQLEKQINVSSSLNVGDRSDVEMSSAIIGISTNSISIPCEVLQTESLFNAKTVSENSSEPVNHDHSMCNKKLRDKMRNNANAKHGSKLSKCFPIIKKSSFKYNMCRKAVNKKRNCLQRHKYLAHNISFKGIYNTYGIEVSKKSSADNKKSFKCCKCHRVFKVQQTLWLHKIGVHNMFPNMFDSNDNNDNYTGLESSFELSKFLGKKTPFRCDICNATFHTQKTLIMHKIWVHNVSLKKIFNSNNSHNKSTVSDNISGNISNNIIDIKYSYDLDTNVTCKASNVNQTFSANSLNICDEALMNCGSPKNVVSFQRQNEVLAIAEDANIDTDCATCSPVDCIIPSQILKQNKQNNADVEQNSELCKLCSIIKKSHLECKNCGRNFKSQRSLNMHVIRVHNASSKEFFGSVNNYNGDGEIENIAVNTAENSIRSSLKVLQQDEQVTASIENNSNFSKRSVKKTSYFECNICLRKFESEKSLSMHFLRVHSNSRKEVIDSSSKCNKDNVVENVPVNASDNTTCREDTSIKFSKHSIIGKKSLKCNTCHLWLHDYNELKSGVRNSNNDLENDEVSFKCDICDKTFFTCQQALQMHKYAAHNISLNRAIECNMCDYVIFSEKALRMHKYHAHDVSLNKIVTCDICEASFKSKKELQMHKYNAHGVPIKRKKDVTTSNDSYNRVSLVPNCPVDTSNDYIINARSENRYSLRNICSLAEVSFKCDLCGHDTSFATQVALRAHKFHAHKISLKKPSYNFLSTNESARFQAVLILKALQVLECRKKKSKHSSVHTSKKCSNGPSDSIDVDAKK